MKNYIKILLLSVFAVSACTKEQVPEVPVASILMNEEQLTLSKGKTFALSVTMLPEDATDKTIVWKSTKESVATVSPDGLVTAVGYGTSYIVATNPASSLTAACMVTVEMRGPYQIIVSEVGGSEIAQTIFGYPGMTLSLEARSTDGDDHFYDWTSSVADYVSADKGMLTWGNAFAAQAPTGYILYGETEIEVKAEDGTATSFKAVNNVLSSTSIFQRAGQYRFMLKPLREQLFCLTLYTLSDQQIVQLSKSFLHQKDGVSRVQRLKAPQTSF